MLYYSGRLMTIGIFCFTWYPSVLMVSDQEKDLGVLTSGTLLWTDHQ